MVVIDCSITMTWCYADEWTAASDDVLRYTLQYGAVVPPIWVYEVLNSLGMSQQKKRMTAQQSADVSNFIATLPIDIADMPPLSTNHLIYDLSAKHRLTIYDASYLALAIEDKLPLATLDKALRQAAQAEHVPLCGHPDDAILTVTD